MSFLKNLFGGVSSASPKIDIHDVVERGDVEAVRLLLKRHPELISSEKNGWLPLHTAARAGHKEWWKSCWPMMQMSMRSPLMVKGHGITRWMGATTTLRNCCVSAKKKLERFRTRRPRHEQILSPLCRQAIRLCQETLMFY